MPKVSIIILNWNGWEDTKECLESLNKLASSQDANFEVILIDNGSKESMSSLSVIPAKAGIQDPGSRVKPRMTQGDGEFSNLKITQIFNEENLGFAGGNNVGIKLALERGADYVLLLNNDTTVEPDFLTELVGEAEADERTGIVGPLIYFYPHTLAGSQGSGADKISDGQSLSEDKNKPEGVGVYDDQKIIWSAGGKITNYFTRGELISYREVDGGQYQSPERVDYISGTCLLIKAEVIKKIGLISEDYFLYYEDTDWCQRAKKAGWRCVMTPTAKIFHKASRSATEFSYPYVYYHSRNGLMFGERFGSKIGVYLLSFWIAAKQLAKMSTHYKREWARPVLKGLWDFWVNKKGKLEGYY